MQLVGKATVCLSFPAAGMVMQRLTRGRCHGARCGAEGSPCWFGGAKPPGLSPAAQKPKPLAMYSPICCIELRGAGLPLPGEEQSSRNSSPPQVSASAKWPRSRGRVGAGSPVGSGAAAQLDFPCLTLNLQHWMLETLWAGWWLERSVPEPAAEPGPCAQSLAQRGPKIGKVGKGQRLQEGWFEAWRCRDPRGWDQLHPVCPSI